ncbi:nucleoside phosphorylase domain-containing protein [Diplogelasinospora grovesii]|uniref:Nucleoside phosphorylase domain-containing protein n=1 Tax=Diplogelasinospora grovesii TaxID=303347 RepID=A0AAN6RZ65_9PEZI|nr:nucleoside phosphorylase domain-containing protein [Diplogelasinospora grovesii]
MTMSGNSFFEPPRKRIRHQGIQGSAESQKPQDSYPAVASSAISSQANVEMLAPGQAVLSTTLMPPIRADKGSRTCPNTTGGKDKAAAPAITPSPRPFLSTAAFAAIHDPPSCRKDFQIAIICALPLEYDADKGSKQYGRAVGDTNHYTTGLIGKHNVVLTLLPNIGKAVVAGSAASLRASYPSLKLALLVGICGGVPSPGMHEALLGDVIIGEAIIPYDFSRQFPGSFVPKEAPECNLGGPNKDIRGLIAYLKTEAAKRDLRQSAANQLKVLQDRAVTRCYRYDYRHPGFVKDKLFPAAYHYKHRGPLGCDFCTKETESFCAEAARASCAELSCDESRLILRRRLEVKRVLESEGAQCPEIFIGGIASGDTQNVIAFEMEGAGAWDEVPSVVVKGICDYADSHKDKDWQPFAAVTAASVAKAVLEQYSLTDHPQSAACSIEFGARAHKCPGWSLNLLEFHPWIPYMDSINIFTFFFGGFDSTNSNII